MEIARRQEEDTIICMTMLHDHMSVILTRDDEDIWLSRSITDTDLLMPFCGRTPRICMRIKCQKLVDNVRNDGP